MTALWYILLWFQTKSPALCQREGTEGRKCRYYAQKQKSDRKRPLFVFVGVDGFERRQP